MSTTIKIDPERTVGNIHPHVFGGFAEHLGRCIYGGIYEPGSPLADKDGIRTDVLEALKRLKMPIMRYPGGNFVSGYRWRDGVGPKEERQTRMELAWHDLEPNTFGTNEFIDFCRKLGTEPYFAVNAGDGDMREARDWLEYCNGTEDTSLVRLRQSHGYDAPHNIKYWGIGNEVDGPWQIGFKTAEEYARTYLEYAKVMKWTDPSIKLVASAVSLWESNWVERAQLLLEQAPDHIDYMALHWYVGNSGDERGFADNDFAAYMGMSERFEERLSAYEGLIHALRVDNAIKKDIPMTIDEWNVWYRVFDEGKLEEIYNLEDALVVAMHFNAFFRHAKTVKMANIAQIVNVIAPIFTSPEGMVLQTTFYPFELYAQHAGDTALDVHWDGDTFDSGPNGTLRTLDVSATLNTSTNQLAVFVINRSEHEAVEGNLRLTDATFKGDGRQYVVNGPNVKAENTFATPHQVGTTEFNVSASGNTFSASFEPHSVNALVFDLA